MEATLVDSHCHLDRLEFEKLGGELDFVLSTAQQQGVNYMLCVSIDLETFPKVLALAQAHEHVFASVGIHPNTIMTKEPGVEELIKLADDNNIVAIGETGLDYFRTTGDDLQWQRQRFRTHIEAARQTKKPLIVHSREARDDTLKILEEEGAAEVGGVMHCFVEDWETAQRCIDLNFYISFSGIVTFKSATTLQDVAKRMPLDRMLVETDSPYLAPVPYRGKTNQPAYTRHVAEHIAALRGDSLEAIAEATTDNFFTLFNCKGQLDCKN